MQQVFGKIRQLYNLGEQSRVPRQQVNEEDQFGYLL